MKTQQLVILFLSNCINRHSTTYRGNGCEWRTCGHSLSRAHRFAQRQYH